MTTWDYDFDEGFWFAATTASYKDFAIKKIVVANFTNQNFQDKIKDLCERLNEGWLPS